MPEPNRAWLDGSLTLVIPVHNEAANMTRVIQAAVGTLAQLSPDWHVILVDDGSSDDSAAVARRAMAGEESRLRVIRHQRKLGYGVTVADGLREATTDYVAFMDGDGQFDPEDLRRLAAVMSDADLVAGRRERRADPGYRLIIAGVFNLFVRTLYGVRFRDVDCGLKLMRRRVLDNAAPLLARSALLNTELYFKSQRGGLRIAQVPVPHYPRVAGVRSGARLVPILRALRDLVRLRLRLARQWRAPAVQPARENS
jgi:glycosyltransferase involved in cell wall biosynthesis